MQQKLTINMMGILLMLHKEPGGIMKLEQGIIHASLFGLCMRGLIKIDTFVHLTEHGKRVAYDLSLQYPNGVDGSYW